MSIYEVWLIGILEDLVLAEDRTTEADREMILEGKIFKMFVLIKYFNVWSASEEETNEVTEEHEFYQAGVSRE